TAPDLVAIAKVRLNLVRVLSPCCYRIPFTFFGNLSKVVNRILWSHRLRMLQHWPWIGGPESKSIRHNETATCPGFRIVDAPSHGRIVLFLISRRRVQSDEHLRLPRSIPDDP